MIYDQFYACAEVWEESFFLISSPIFMGFEQQQTNHNKLLVNPCDLRLDLEFREMNRDFT